MYATLVRNLIVIVFMECFVNPGSSCNSQLPPLGPRLLRAKSLFGDFMRTCKKELVEMATIIRSTRLRKVVQVACRVYNTCKESTLGKVRREDMAQAAYLDPIIECLYDATQNTSSTFYTDLQMPEEFRVVSAIYVNCSRKMAKSGSVLLETLDDGIAYGQKAVYAFGWV
ncbi:uncharacterized protein LOC142564755 [Dermacentor variabilis]|uniref:uncharacterized protein LOC142564755 n=1 Tax=Dermacentor variabilis TaxID=34621 RepID=UPI003F5B08F0